MAESVDETPAQNDYFPGENAEISPAETESAVHFEQSDISVNHTAPTAAQEPSILLTKNQEALRKYIKKVKVEQNLLI